MEDKTFALIAQTVKKELSFPGEEPAAVNEPSSCTNEGEYSDNSTNCKIPLNRHATSAGLNIKQEGGFDGDDDYDASEQSPCFSDEMEDQEQFVVNKAKIDSARHVGAALKLENSHHAGEVDKDNEAVPLGLFLNNAHFLNETEQMDGTDTRDKDGSFPEGSQAEIGHPKSKHFPSISALLNSNRKEVVKSTNGASQSSQGVAVSSKEKKVYPKPVVTTSTLIALALKNSKTGCLSSPEVYDFISKTFPYFRSAPEGWKSVVRCRLSSNRLFIKGDGTLSKGNLWALNPEYVTQMDEEFTRWTERPPTGFLDSLVHPAKLASLVKGYVGATTMRNSSHTIVHQLLKSKLSPARANNSPTATMKSGMAPSTKISPHVIKSQLLKKKLSSTRAGNSPTTMNQRRVHPAHAAQSHPKLPAESVVRRSKFGLTSSQLRHTQSPVSQHNRFPSSHTTGNKLHLQKKLHAKLSHSSAVLARLTQDLSQSQQRASHSHVKQHIPSSSPQFRPSSAAKTGFSSALSLNKHELYVTMPKNNPVKASPDHRKQLAKPLVKKSPGNQTPEKRKPAESEDEDNQKRKKKRMWVDPLYVNRSTDGVMAKLYPQLIHDDEKFYNFTMMSRDSFEILLKKMGDQISRMDTNWRKAIKPRERLLLTLRFLVSAESSRVLSSQFQIGISTIRDIIYGACDAICSCLKDSELPRLTTQAFKSISVKFYQKWKYPHCIGALGTKSINLQIPGNSNSSEANEPHKGKISILLQGVVDADGNFIAVDVVDLSSDLGGSVLKWSAFGDALYKDQLPIPKSDKFLESANDELNEPLPYVFIGGSEHPHLKNLMRPFAQRGLNDLRRNYNQRHHKARGITDRVFKSMAAKWSVLRTNLNMNLINAYKVVLTCCVLHNYLKNREGCEGLEEEVQVPAQKSRKKKNYSYLCQPTVGRPSQDAMINRDRFARILNTDLFIPLEIESEISPGATNLSLSDKNTSVEVSNPCLSVSTQEQSDHGNTSDLSVPTQNITDDGNASNLSVPNQNITDDENTSDLPVPTQNITDDGNASNLSVPTQNNTDDGNASDLSVPTQNITDDGNASDLSVPTQNITDDGNTSDLSVPTNNITDDGNASNLSVPNQNITDDENTSDLPVPTQNITDDENTSDLSIPTQNITDDENTSDLSIPNQNITDDGNTSDLSVLIPTQNITDDGNTSDLSVPTQNITDERNTSGLSTPTEKTVDDENTANVISVLTKNLTDDDGKA